jgi:hypothetical protein
VGREVEGTVIRVTHYEPDSVLSTGQVAALLGLSRRSVLRIPQEDLDYWETAGGEHRKHRRYEAGTVRDYAAGFLSLTVMLAGPASDVAQG